MVINHSDIHPGFGTLNENITDFVADFVVLENVVLQVDEALGIAQVMLQCLKLFTPELNILMWLSG